ncbi:hypothetical protein SBDP2_590002 [Syntrophobacter sp. SbD2]|nr:hypothetical protein SBDP2_590002 [Syntrophobacter sp. SbD2]
MGGKKKPELDDPEQSARFIELAKEYPVSEEEFQELFKEIAEAKPHRKLKKTLGRPTE